MANCLAEHHVTRPPANNRYRWWQFVKRIDPAWYWGLNISAALLLFVWLLIDARFEASVAWWQFENSNSAANLRDMGDWWWLSLRNRAVLVLATLVISSGVLMIVAAWAGPAKSRTIRAWFAAMSIIAIWIGLLVSWQDVTWLGKRYRLQAVIGEFEQVAERLKVDWPTCDDEMPGLGQFMAYPTYDPRTLILLTLPELRNTNTSFAVVEGGGEVLRFELVGAERGDWLEWHPPDSVPAGFVSGLGENYSLSRYQQLQGGWFLARYQ